MLSRRGNTPAALDLSRRGRALVISDFHMGAGRRDDLGHNGELLIRLLNDYYLAGGWHLILNGDIEELHRFSLGDIQKQWPPLYRVFDAFAAEHRLYKNLGNHDEDLAFEKNYPYPLSDAVLVTTGVVPVYVYHGHQSSRLYTDYNRLLRFPLRYILKPLGIPNIASARSPRRRFSVERRAYAFSRENRCVSIIGHTHRSLFESLGREEFIKFAIENLCRDYAAAAAGKHRERIAAEVQTLRRELGKLNRSERRQGQKSLYGDGLPVPCLFNAGSAISRKGVNAIELDRERIALVYWFREGEGSKFVNRGGYVVEPLGKTPFRRTVLNQERLDYVKARIDLLAPE